LPLGKYVIGDNAYICTEHILTPFSGPEKSEPGKDAYNFFLSQCRIRIEMTFGQFVNKWRFFGRPVPNQLTNLGKLFMCATRLHNFCINERLLEQNISDNDIDLPRMLPDAVDEALLRAPRQVNEEVASIRGNSIMRDILVQKVIAKNLTRPEYNRARNR
jgi:DDE superfamily endonuclease